jgi:hypothetical protein
MKKDRYIVMSNKASDKESLGEKLRETTVVCDTFTKAYELGLFLAGITAPDKAYRRCLEEVKLYMAVQVSQREYISMSAIDAPPTFTILKSKSY